MASSNKRKLASEILDISSDDESPPKRAAPKKVKSVYVDIFSSDDEKGDDKMAAQGSGTSQDTQLKVHVVLPDNEFC